MESSRFEHYLTDLVAELSEEARTLFVKLPYGKRLRARLIGMIAGDGDDALLLASVVELIHAASLLHDDVIDDASLRRGVPSMNALYGNKTAIMLGDILYAHAFSKLPRLGETIATIVARSVVRLSEGELADVSLSASFNPDEAKYLDMIDKKTAALIEASAEAAAILAGYDPRPFALYGRNIGLAFQIVDDLLDITQDEATLGKPSMNDLAEGKTTLPFQYLARALEGDERTVFLAMFKQPPGERTQSWIDERMVRHGIYDQTRGVIASLCGDAEAAIAAAEIPAALKTSLTAMIASMSQRVF